jgi:hypothetical protein
MMDHAQVMLGLPATVVDRTGRLPYASTLYGSPLSAQRIR